LLGLHVPSSSGGNTSIWTVIMCCVIMMTNAARSVAGLGASHDSHFAHPHMRYQNC
jgi:hypothetical protein